MSEFEITPETFTADAVGTPGHRTFYMQSRGVFGTLTFLVEKEQVAVLADRLRDLLILVDQDDTIRGQPPVRDPAMGLEDPLEPEWRVGTMGLAYNESEDQVVVFLQPVEEDDEEQAREPDEETGVRFLLRRDQVRAFVLHSLAVVGEGRPRCQLCGLPMDPEGHNCPASNGHYPAA